MTTTTKSLTWDMESLFEVVQPMRHALGSRLPLLNWFHPLSAYRGGKDVAQRLIEPARSGRLREIFLELWKRGMTIPVEMLWGATPESIMAVATVVHEAGLPLHLIAPGVGGPGQNTLYGDPNTWIESPGTTGKVERWPCLPLADPTADAAWMRNWVERFKNAGMTIAGVWADFEGPPPHPWNGIYEAQLASPEYRKHFPPGVLDDRERFIQFAINLRHEVISQAMADPVLEAFPDALVGNYYDCISGQEVPYIDHEGCVYPPCEFGRLNTVMPSTYGLTRQLPRYYNADWAVTPRSAEQAHFTLMMRSMSTANANKRPGIRSIPFVSRYLPEGSPPRFNLGLSKALYREFIRHAILRGSDSFFLLNLGFPTKEQLVTPADGFEAMEDARSVLDELLAHRRFLDDGQPMCFDVPAMFTTGAVWSGLRRGDECLIRAFSLGQSGRRVAVEAFPAKPGQPAVTLAVEAPVDGASYIVRRDSACQPTRV